VLGLLSLALSQGLSGRTFEKLCVLCGVGRQLALCKEPNCRECVRVQSLMLYARKNGHMSTRFEKLVKLSGTNLTQSVYPMITYVQVIDF